jgi:hypothetical protein
MGGGGLAQGAAGERRRRTGGGAAAGARIPARTGMGQANVLHGQPHWGLGIALRQSVGSGDERKAELVDGCPATAAGEITPAGWPLERTNKRAEKLLGTLGVVGARRVGDASDRKVGFTVSTNGGNGGSPVRRPLTRRTVRRLYRQAPRRLRVFLHTKAMGEVVQARRGAVTPRRRARASARTAARPMVGRRGACALGEQGGGLAVPGAAHGPANQGLASACVYGVVLRRPSRPGATSRAWRPNHSV